MSDAGLKAAPDQELPKRTTDRDGTAEQACGLLRGPAWKGQRPAQNGGSGCLPGRCCVPVTTAGPRYQYPSHLIDEE